MRLKIVLKKIGGIKLPRASQEIVQKFILKYAGINNKDYQNFCFSNLKGNFETNEDKTITFTQDFNFFISSSDEQFIKTLYDNLTDKVILNNEEVLVESKNITTFSVNYQNYLIKTLSPVTVYEKVDGKFKFYSPEDDRFFEIINRNLQEKYRDKDNFCIEFKDVTKVKKIITRYNKAIVEAYLFECQIEGSKEAIKALYNDGIGNRCFQGFGMCLLGF